MIVAAVMACMLGARADAVDDFVDSRAINGPKAAVMVVDLADGAVLAQHNADMPLIPASVMKCVTVATLLEKMDVDDRFETPVYLTGHVADGVVDGNLVVKGSGDPSLNSRHDPASADIVGEISRALREKGIREIRGRIIVDQCVFAGPAVPDSWMTADLSQAYGTGSHGFNFEDNASGSRSVANPAGVFESRLKLRLRGQGVRIGEEEIENGREHLLLTHVSAPLDEIMRSCMMRSDNQFAESLLRTYGVRSGKSGDTSEAADMEKKYWKKKKLNTDDIDIIDGSGLSRRNRLTARFLADVLASRSGDPFYASFFPLAGQEGTLRNFMASTPLEGYVAMKTGSMNGIQCYAGYKLDDDYAPTHVIVVMLNEMRNRASAREAVKKMLMDIFENIKTEI